MRSFAVLTLTLALAVPAAAAAPPPSTDPVGHASSSRVDLVEALAVLHEWDARRASAWVAADQTWLRSLYVAGSAAGGSDSRLLRAYTERRLVVRRLVTQVFAARVLDRGTSTIRLRVFDRVAGGEVVRAGVAHPLASSRPVTRTVVFRLVQHRWRVAGVSGSG